MVKSARLDNFVGKTYAEVRHALKVANLSQCDATKRFAQWTRYTTVQ